MFFKKRFESIASEIKRIEDKIDSKSDASFDYAKESVSLKNISTALKKDLNALAFEGL